MYRGVTGAGMAGRLLELEKHPLEDGGKKLGVGWRLEEAPSWGQKDAQEGGKGLKWSGNGQVSNNTCHLGKTSPQGGPRRGGRRGSEGGLVVCSRRRTGVGGGRRWRHVQGGNGNGNGRAIVGARITPLGGWGKEVGGPGGRKMHKRAERD